MLLGEIHHRVKNNLQMVNSLLDLQSTASTTQALDMLRESQNRIKSMALIHQTFYESKDFVQVDFSNFLETLAPTLVSLLWRRFRAHHAIDRRGRGAAPSTPPFPAGWWSTS